MNQQPYKPYATLVCVIIVTASSVVHSLCGSHSAAFAWLMTAALMIVCEGFKNTSREALKLASEAAEGWKQSVAINRKAVDEVVKLKREIGS